jgi:hypothetical protein
VRLCSVHEAHGQSFRGQDASLGAGRRRGPGEEIIIAKNGVAKARLGPIGPPKRRPSELMKIHYIAEDFDLPDESIIKDFEGSD